MDGTPTTILLDLDRDERRVLDWIGMSTLPDGQRHWFDLAARPIESVHRPAPKPPLSIPALSHESLV